MQVHLSRAADRKQIAWGNGAGLACDLHVHPPGSTRSGDYDVRIATATIEHEVSDFTRYPGYIRLHQVIEGSSQFTVNGTAYNAAISQECQSYLFNGEDALKCTLRRGPARAINVIHRPDMAAQVHPLSVSRTERVLSLQPVDLLATPLASAAATIDTFFALQSANVIIRTQDHQAHKLEAHDALTITRNERDGRVDIQMTAEGSTNIWHASVILPKGV